MDRQLLCQLLLLIAVIQFAAANCKNSDYTPLGNGRCYRAFKTPNTYAKAESGCRLTGGALVSIHNDTDNYIIGLWLGGNLIDEAWIGLTCDEDENCSWLDGTPLDYTNFQDTPPDLDNGDCFYMQQGMADLGRFNVWGNAKCDKKKMFICVESAPIPPRTTKKPRTTTTTRRTTTTVTTTTKPYTTVYSRDCGPYLQYDGHCYDVNAGPLNEPEAEAYCVKNGGHLVSIHDAQTNQFIYSTLRSSGVVSVTAWIGLRFLPNHAYMWTDGTFKDYSNIPSSVSPMPGQCFTMSVVDILYPQQWMPQNCTESRMPFICEMPPRSSPTTVGPIRNSCGQTDYTSNSGKINSPNYPYNFRGSLCTYTISVSYYLYVNIQVPAIQSDGYWTLSIYGGSTAYVNNLIYTITSNDLPRILQYSSPYSEMTVTFYSEDNDVGQPFFMTYNGTQVPLFPFGYYTTTTVIPLTTTAIRTTTTAPMPCDPQWTYDTARNLCFKLSDPAPFYDSQAVCRHNQANLLSIHSYNQETDLFNFLTNFLQKNTYNLWIGLAYSSETWNWEWMDKTPTDYTDWMELPSTNLTCTSAVSLNMNSRQGWVAIDCDQWLRGLCYKQPNY